MGPASEKNNASADAELVKRVQRGDSGAYNVLVIRYQHKIVQLASKYVSDQADALDIAQEAFIKAYKAIGTFRGESSFYTWLYRIAVNCAKNYLESSARSRNSVDVDAEDFASKDVHGALISGETPDKIMESEELGRVIKKALADLSPDLSEAIILREIEGLSYDEIAERTGIPVGTVRSRIFRAREYIESCMAKLGQ